MMRLLILSLGVCVCVYNRLSLFPVTVCEHSFHPMTTGKRQQLFCDAEQEKLGQENAAID